MPKMHGLRTPVGCAAISRRSSVFSGGSTFGRAAAAVPVAAAPHATPAPAAAAHRRAVRQHARQHQLHAGAQLTETGGKPQQETSSSSGAPWRMRWIMRSSSLLSTISSSLYSSYTVRSSCGPGGWGRQAQAGLGGGQPARRTAAYCCRCGGDAGGGGAVQRPPAGLGPTQSGDA